MVQKCYSCGSAKTDNVKLHGFPKDINLREKWVAQIKKDVPVIITQYTRLCSKHFTNDDYYQSSFGNDILKPDAVPSRFFCSRKSLLPEFEVRESMSTGKPILTVNDNLENLMLEEEIVVNEDENNSTVSMNNDTEEIILQANENIDITKVHLSEKKRKLLRYAGDFSEEDLETPRKRKMFWKTYQQMIKTKNDKIKLLQQKNRSLKSQINNLNSLIDDLQSQNKLNANGSYMLKVNTV
ncbi:THAP domain-containing protein 1-like [Melanaphis sacchari]|uniref:THAP domain-containing protein 1-like n=1 Tax=Melanaphis sacchari TaxID=742174 RepID=UPI000DC158AC|nr:THAP domain-containing protein 1-like [Melanaphis sacchari]